MRFLIVFTFLSVLFSGGCSSLIPLENHSPLPTLHWYVEHYGQYSSDEAESFLKGMTRRIQSRADVQVIILATEDPMAFTTGGGFIVVSAGLIRTLRNEAELAFILAHELSHEILGHTTVRQFVSSQNSSRDERQRIEMEADAQALMILIRANYDPHAALGCLQRTYTSFPDLRFSSSHPELETRVSALSDLIFQSGWTPSGTIDTPEFRNFKKIFNTTAHSPTSLP